MYECCYSSQNSRLNEILCLNSDGYNDQLPIFVGHVENKTERAGNSVILVCKVKNLGFYKVSLSIKGRQLWLNVHSLSRPSLD